jgi:ABC-type branched-subunit amino acid transport system substrate-binding protein
VPDNLATAVDATLARMAALKEAKDQLERRSTALRGMHQDDGHSKAEVVRLLNNALIERGLTGDDLRYAGVTHESVMKVLRTAK